MRWATYRHRRPGSPPRVGLLVGGALHGLGEGETLLGLLGDDGERLSLAAERAEADPAEVVVAADVDLLAPIPRPPSVRDFYAFEGHVRNARRARGLDVPPEWYELPVFYFSNPHCIVGPGAEVAAPPTSAELDYELEVAAVVGRGGADLDADEAEAYIAGYMIMNDWSARDLQRREMAVGLGPAKGKDFATTLGPWLVTPEELRPRRSGTAYALEMTAAVNGRVYSRARLDELHWSFAEMVAYASRGASVAPGDVVGSGTAGGGCILELASLHGAEDYPWLRPGDEVALAVDGLGEVTNRVVAGRPTRSLTRR